MLRRDIFPAAFGGGIVHVEEDMCRLKVSVNDAHSALIRRFLSAFLALYSSSFARDQFRLDFVPHHVGAEGDQQALGYMYEGN